MAAEKEPKGQENNPENKEQQGREGVEQKGAQPETQPGDTRALLRGPEEQGGKETTVTTARMEEREAAEEEVVVLEKEVVQCTKDLQMLRSNHNEM